MTLRAISARPELEVGAGSVDASMVVAEDDAAAWSAADDAAVGQGLSQGLSHIAHHVKECHLILSKEKLNC